MGGYGDEDDYDALEGQSLDGAYNDIVEKQMRELERLGGAAQQQAADARR